ncbi:tetratricopeptide repeat protein [Aquimarina sp. 2201CG1-2-11]|uniref:tetratricopeptide repeat protein n=1 Tax=Aquimarina discodermiae TaxID=3231043 RepID=UPI003462EDFF
MKLFSVSFQLLFKNTPVTFIILLVIHLYGNTQGFSQESTIIEDSLRIEKLYGHAIEVINTDPTTARKNLEKTLDELDNNLIPKYPDNHHFLLKKALIIERLAYFLRRENKYDKALAYLHQSLKLKKKVNETYTLGYTYSQIAWMWMYQLEFEKSRINLDSAYYLSKKYNNIKEKIRTLSRYGVVYLNTKEYVKAEQHHHRAVRLADSLKEISPIAATNANYADFLRRRGRYEESVPYLEKAIEKHKEGNNQIGLESGYFALGITYREAGRLDKAIDALNQAITMTKNLQNKSLIHSRYFQLSKAYAKLNDHKNAYLTLKKYVTAKNKAQNESHYKKMANLESKYKYEQQRSIDSIQFTKEKREVELIAHTESAKKQFYFLLLILVIIAAGVIGFLARRMYLSKTQIALERLEKEKIQKELLDQQVTAKEEEIKRLVADNTMRLNFKQELLDQLNKELSEKNPEDLKTSITSLTKELKSQIITEDKLSSLQHKIDDINHGFDAKLVKLYPELTKTEREVCSLLRLNLSIKEIMTIRNASQDAIKSIRYRIRKKMGLSAKEELEQFIQNIV